MEPIAGVVRKRTSESACVESESVVAGPVLAASLGLAQPPADTPQIELQNRFL